jgi:hypothetical protein
VQTQNPNPVIKHPLNVENENFYVELITNGIKGVSSGKLVQLYWGPIERKMLLEIEITKIMKASLASFLCI